MPAEQAEEEIDLDVETSLMLERPEEYAQAFMQDSPLHRELQRLGEEIEDIERQLAAHEETHGPYVEGHLLDWRIRATDARLYKRRALERITVLLLQITKRVSQAQYQSMRRLNQEKNKLQQEAKRLNKESLQLNKEAKEPSLRLQAQLAELQQEHRKLKAERNQLQVDLTGALARETKLKAKFQNVLKEEHAAYRLRVLLRRRLEELQPEKADELNAWVNQVDQEARAWWDEQQANKNSNAGTEQQS
jgi:hypothetical protein